MKAAIVIPFFRDEPLWYEEASVKQAIKVLYAYEHILIVPQEFNTRIVKNWYQSLGKDLIVKEFNTSYFESTVSYNKMMLAASFYEAFEEYDYMLIYQTDAWIFRDELGQWMEKDYDYIGAPWINWIHASYQAKNKNFYYRLLWHLGRRRFDAVGNGGFSLRKIRSCIDLLHLHANAAATYKYNEDFFFSFYLPKKHSSFAIPKAKEALEFAFDENPEQVYQINNWQLPMGCHAWPRYYAFWKNHI